MSDTYYVTVKVQVKGDKDINKIISEMEYNLDHEDIIDTEIIDFSDVLS